MKKFGYTMIELMVVIGVMAVIGLLSIYALNSSNDSQTVDSFAKQIATDMRSLQNKAMNGAAGSNCYVMEFLGDGVVNYALGSKATTTNISIPKGVTLDVSDGGGAYPNQAFVYFLHPSATYTDCTGSSANACGGVACNGNVNYQLANPIRFIITKGSARKFVFVEFSGTQVGRVYVQ